MTKRPPIRTIVGLLLFGHLLLTLAFSLVIPLGEAPDEADHWAYIVYIAEEKALPIGPSVTQSKHPPFYHATAALFSLLGDPSVRFLRANPDVQFAQPANHATHGWSPNFFIHTVTEEWPWQDGVLAFRFARLWSILLSTFTMAAFYGLARTVLPPNRPWLLLGAVGALAFWPEFSFISSTANNDNAAALFGTLALWGAMAIYKAEGRLAAGWWTPLAIGFGLLSKVSTVGVWPAVGLALLFGILAGAQRDKTIGAPQIWFRTLLIKGCILFGIGLLIASPWLIRNWSLYGDPLGLEMARQTVDQRVTPWAWPDTIWLLKGWFLSFWGKFGAIGHVALPTWLYTGLTIVTAISTLGLVRYAIISIRQWIKRDRREAVHPPWFMTMLLVAFATVALVIGRYSLLALGTDQGRLLYPAIAAIVLLFVVGLFAWIPRKHDKRGALTITAAMLFLSIYALVVEVRPAFAPPISLTQTFVSTALAQAEESTLPSTQITPSVDFGELALIGWTLADPPVLYWQAQEPPTVDWRTVLRITAEDGTLIWEWKRSPARGRWSTDRWPAESIVADRYEIRWPDNAPAGTYRIEVGMQPFGGELIIPTQAGQPVNEGSHPFIQLGWVTR